MVRSVLAVVIDVVLWMVAFYALATGLALLWPDYAIHGRQWVREGAFTFTPLMAFCNLVLWVLAEIVAWDPDSITSKVTPRFAGPPGRRVRSYVPLSLRAMK